MRHVLKRGGFVLRTHGHGVGDFVPAGIEIGTAYFFEDAVVRGFCSKNIFQSVIGVVVHDGFATGVIGFFGFD